jgi:hypothetical protein
MYVSYLLSCLLQVCVSCLCLSRLGLLSCLLSLHDEIRPPTRNRLGTRIGSGIGIGVGIGIGLGLGLGLGIGLGLGLGLGIRIEIKIVEIGMGLGIGLGLGLGMGVGQTIHTDSTCCRQ